MRPYYEHGGITIYHGDCREVLPHVSFDHLCTSPPYNCGMDYGTHDDSMDVAEYFSFIEDCIASAARSLRSGGYAAVNVPSWIGSRDSQVFAFEELQAIVSRHIPFEDVIIWDKGPANGAAWGNYPTSPRIRANHEWILIHKAPGASLGKSDITWADWSRFTTSVWSVPTTLPYAKHHPATFPSAIPSRLIRLYTAPCAVVCDPFMGTGTTIAVAKSLGRQAIGIEINERYCEIAANRLAQDSLPLEVA